MADGLLHAEAVEKLEASLLAKWPKSTRVAGPAVKSRFPHRQNLAAVWLLHNAIQEEPRDLLLAVDWSCPWSLPLVFLPNATTGVTYPHVEVDGHLCLTRSDEAFDVPVGIEHVCQLVEEAQALLAAGAANLNVADFLDEAPSYWSLAEPTRGELLLSSSFHDNAAVWCAPLGKDVVVAHSRVDLEKWFKALGAKMDKVEPALIARLATPLLPSAYPLTLADLFRVIDNAGAKALLDHCLGTWQLRAPIPVVLSFSHQQRQIFLGASIQPPGALRMPGVRKTGLPGFRYGVGSPGAKRRALAQYQGRFPHITVVPVHRDFLLERTTGAVSSQVRDARVAVIGCGAIGGHIALLLLQAGVGHMLLADHDLFDWRNIGRHVLDGLAVGMNKAEALAQAGRRRFPDADITSLPCRWQSVLRDCPAELLKCDLVISSTAHAASNLHLDWLVGRGEMPSTVYAWVEPLAFASHAVYRASGGFGLDRVLGKDGLMLEPVVDLGHAPPLEKESACGAMYQPFSAVNAMQGVHLAVELALDALEGRVAASTQRSWVGAESVLHAEGLLLSSPWSARVRELGFSRRYDRLLLP